MKTSIIVQNLKCEDCAQTITTELSRLDSISNLLVDVETNTVSFVSRNFNVALAVKNKLKALGYPAISRKNSLAVNDTKYATNM